MKASSPPGPPHGRPLTRRQALRQGSLLVGGAFFGAATLPRLFGQTPEPLTIVPSDSVDWPEHPIAQMRRAMGDAPLEAVPVAKRVFMLTGQGGNVGVFIGDEGLLVVDSGSGRSPATESMQTALREISDRPVRYGVNTHWHFDHTDGNANLRALGAIIVAHRSVRTRLETPQTLAFFNARFPSAPKERLPTVTFDHAMALDVGSIVAELQHVPPAHTDGDTIVHWPAANVIHSGDVFVNGTYPFIDTDSGGSLAGMIAATEKLLSLANQSTRIIPGHGPLATYDDLAATDEMLRTVQARVARERAAGRSLDEAIAAKPLADLDQTWSGGFINSDTFLQIVYDM